MLHHSLIIAARSNIDRNDHCLTTYYWMNEIFMFGMNELKVYMNNNDD